jgi:hypothetical protein
MTNTKNMSQEEKIIINTGLGMMIQMIEREEPLFLNLLIGHPYKELLTHENIMKLSEKFKVNGEL